MKKERKPLRFWQKIYLFTLALFLLCLAAGVFSLASFTHRRSVAAVSESCETEAHYIAQALEKDLPSYTKPENRKALLEAYGIFYRKKDVLLQITDGDTPVWSAFPEGTEAPAKSPAFVFLEGKRHLVRVEEAEGCTILYGKDVSHLDSDLRTMLLTFGGVTLLISLLLAAVLFFLLRRLSRPLDRLRETAERISAGERGIRADERGRDEFARLGASFNEMLDSLERTADEKQRLVDNMAHELRTPLTVIRGYAEYLQTADPGEEDRIEATSAILGESDRLRRISEKLLDSAWLRGHPAELAELDLAALLRTTCERFTPKAAEKGVVLLPELPDSLPLRGDETLLDILFSNLLDNAIKATPTGGNVRVRAGAADGKIIASVMDTGRGMTAEQIARITEPFYRTDTARSRADGGAGLGLALVARIAEAHGAALHFDSIPDFGTAAQVVF